MLWARICLLIFPFDFSRLRGWGGCCLVPPYYTLFRLTLLVLIVADLTYLSTFHTINDLLQFTVWGIILTCGVNLIMTLQNLLNWLLAKCPTAQYWRVGHFLFTLVLAIELFINLVYWGGIFPYSCVYLWGSLGLEDILNPILEHVVPLLIMLVDLQFNLVVVWNFMFIPFEYAILFFYLIVNCIYTLQVGVIYQLITYKNWLTAVFIIACGIVMLISHAILRLFCRCCKQQRVLRMLSLCNRPRAQNQTIVGNQSQMRLQVTNIMSGNVTPFYRAGVPIRTV